MRQWDNFAKQQACETSRLTQSQRDLYFLQVATTTRGPASTTLRKMRGLAPPQSSAITSDARVFTIGGSWSGPRGGKNGEVWSPSTGKWTPLPGAAVAPMLTADVQGVYRSDNHAWLFGWKGGFVFQAGPSKAMNW